MTTAGSQPARSRANQRLLDAFAALWNECPDMRFGQLVMNLSRTPGGFTDIWEWSNADWLERIQKMYDDLAAA